VRLTFHEKSNSDVAFTPYVIVVLPRIYFQCKSDTVFLQMWCSPMYCTDLPHFWV